jgi:hypothetical protein
MHDDPGTLRLAVVIHNIFYPDVDFAPIDRTVDPARPSDIS